MSIQNIIRAWKDPDFRASLSEAERALLPANPAGTIDLTPAQMEAVGGGRMPVTDTRACCSAACTFAPCLTTVTV
jgi:mersacidin/lichenicidin family type 2 lantibiotic